MNDWQQRFCKKVGTVREASSGRFEEVARKALAPIFEEYQKFTAQQGFVSSAPLANPGVRTFRFAMTENAYTLLTFRLSGLDDCECIAEFVVPSRGKLPSLNQRIELAEASDVWTRQVFERMLDHFIDAFSDGLGQKSKGALAAAAA
jgi:hypothetical protein